MNDCKRLTADSCIDLEAECLYRYVYGAEDIFNPHCHDFYEIFMTISGTVTHWINGVTQRLAEGSLVFIRPDDVHGYIYSDPDSSETAYVNLTFTRETADLLFNYLSDSFPYQKLLDCDMPPKVLLNSIEKKHLLKKISELSAVNWQDKSALKVRMRAILADVFVRYFYDMPLDSESNAPLWLTQLISDMERPENFVFGIKRMIELSGKSREHLARSIKKHYGVTVAQCIWELRINYASNLLLHTNTPILDICFNCGFQSVSYFYKVFKGKYGLSPNEFRKQYR